jgi:hypothetical protein
MTFCRQSERLLSRVSARFAYAAMLHYLSSDDFLFCYDSSIGRAAHPETLDLACSHPHTEVKFVMDHLVTPASYKIA